MRLQTKSLEKQREENNEEDADLEEDEDIFEHHHYKTFFRSFQKCSLEKLHVDVKYELFTMRVKQVKLFFKLRTF